MVEQGKTASRCNREKINLSCTRWTFQTCCAAHDVAALDGSMRVVVGGLLSHSLAAHTADRLSLASLPSRFSQREVLGSGGICFAYVSASTTPQACTHSAFTTLRRSSNVSSGRSYSKTSSDRASWSTRSRTNGPGTSASVSRSSGTSAVNTAKQTTTKTNWVCSQRPRQNPSRTPRWSKLSRHQINSLSVS